MTTIQDRIIDNTKKELTDILMIMYNCGDTNNCLLDIQKILIQSIKEVEEETRKEEKGNLEQCMVYLFKKLSDQKTIKITREKTDWLWGSMCSWVNEYIENLSITNKEKQNE